MIFWYIRFLVGLILALSFRIAEKKKIPVIIYVAIIILWPAFVTIELLTIKL